LERSGGGAADIGLAIKDGNNKKRTSKRCYVRPDDCGVVCARKRPVEECGKKVGGRTAVSRHSKVCQAEIPRGVNLAKHRELWRSQEHASVEEEEKRKDTHRDTYQQT
jgi:hypothetical protein